MKNKIIKTLIAVIVILKMTILTLPTKANTNNLSDLIIPVRFTFDIDTEGLEQGNAIPLEITQDVFYEGKKLFQQGGAGFATIDELKKARFLGRGGKIRITTGQVVDVNGRSYQIIINAKANGDYKISSVAGLLVGSGIAYEIANAGITSGTATGTLIGVGALLIPVGYLFSKGKEAKLAKGKIMFAHIM